MKYLLFAGFANVTRQLGVEHSDRAQGWIRFKYIYFFLLSPPPPGWEYKHTKMYV